MLLGIGVDLPKRLLVHGFVNVGGAKMSKTVGNVVDPNDVIDQYGLDAFRYYFSRHIPTQDDGDFTWEKFEAAYNTELANDLGNLVARVANMLIKYQAGVVGDVPLGEHDMREYHGAFERLEFNKALDEVWLMVRSLNKYIDDVKPWEIAKRKEKDPDAEPHLAEVLGHCVGNLLQIADLLVPFLPGSAAVIHQTFESGVVSQMPGIMFPKMQQYTGKNESQNKNQPTG